MFILAQRLKMRLFLKKYFRKANLALIGKNNLVRENFGAMCKGAFGVKGGDFKKSQRDFLLTLFNNNGGPKIRERDAHIKMVATFKDKDEDSDYSLRLVLSESQIKAWFSSESGRRKKAAVNRVFEKGFTELSQSIDLQDNQEGGHDLNGGVVEEGAPPPPPLPSPPPPPSPPPL